jgi:putative peptide zinc metalloprotease protein
LYLVWPAFYTDVTDSYRLDRAGRIRTDLGGLYFNAVVVVLTYVWWWATGWEALLLLVATQILQMVTQLLPLLRFDGYHLLADLAGVPDLYHRIKPTLLGLLPNHWHSPEQRVLTPRARALITLWVLVSVPLMGFMLFAMVRAVPRLVGTAGAALGADVAALADAARGGQVVDVAGHGLEALGVALPVLACFLVLGRFGFRFFRGLVRWGRGSAPKRVAAVALGAAVVGGLVWAWWPDPGTYRPIQPDERGTLTAILQPAQAQARHARLEVGAEVRRERAGTPAPSSDTPQIGTAAADVLSSGRPLVAAFEKGAALPTRDDPALAMVLVPAEDGTGARPSTSPDGAGAPDDVWVFPFDKPLEPAEGDNQALAVATEDGSVTYDVAFALIWAEGDEVLNVNEAHAYASCTDCVAVAVAFQVVLVMDDARVVVPQNLAVAANYDCYRCITAAIANQLVLSVPGEPGEEQLHALAAVWNELVLFAQGITSRTLTEITDQLEAFKAEIVQILATAPPVEPAPPSPTDAPTPAAGTSPPTEEEPAPPPSPSTDPTTPVPEPTGSGPTTPEPTSTPEGSSTPDTTTTPEGSSTPDATTTPDSTPTPEPTPTPDPALAPEPSPVETTSPAP